MLALALAPLLLVQDAPAPAAAREPVPLVDVWRAGADGYHTYRIPSLIVAPDGALVAFAEGRRDGRGDAGNVDLVTKRSTDGGATWSAQRVLWDDEGNTCGNPCPVVDRETGRIHLLVTHNLGVDTEAQIVDGTSKGTRTVWVLASDDSGRTWSAPRELTKKAKAKSWTWTATGPGAGIQLEQGPHAGRLVIPCDHIESRTKRYLSHVLLSDDHGATWRVGGRSPKDGVNECEVAELSDGRLLLNMRNYDRSQRRRQVAFSADGGETWSGQRHDEALVEPTCQASLRRLSWPRGGAPGVLVFSNPASETKRERLTLRASLDDGATWPRRLVLYAGPAAYSCLAALPDGRIACLFEADGYGRITLARVPLERLR